MEKKKIKKSMGAANKRKGSSAERKYAKLFRELGFTFCKTSRSTSRLLDDAGVDLNFLPFNVQLKAGYQKGMNHSKVLSIIKERLPLFFPPGEQVHDKPSILIHAKQGKAGQPRSEFDDLVTMSFEDFKKIICKATWE